MAEQMPMLGALAQQGSSTPFRSLQEKPGWGFAVGGTLPAENQILNIVITEGRKNLPWGGFTVAMAQERMDSLYLGREWTAGACWKGRHAFAHAQGALRQQLWMGFSSQWRSGQRLSLGFRHLNLAATGGISHVSGCLLPEIAIQWSLGECYRMNWMLAKEEIRTWSLTLGQELAVGRNLRIGLGWRYPAQVFSAGVRVAFSGMQIESAQFWHPVLPSQSWASGAIQP